MEWIAIFALGGLVAWLWQRMNRAERRLAEIDDYQERLFEYVRGLRRGQDAEIPAEPVPNTDPQPDEEHVQRRVTVPAVLLRRDSETAERREVEAAPQSPPSSEEIVGESPNEPVFSRFSFDLEDIFGRRLPIWAGGITLAVAGVFLVRYSIESGLLTPLVRVILAFLFGVALLGGAEAAFRFRDKVADPRVAQALAGAGLATLYAGFYLAGTQYGLVGQTVAFLGLGGVTAASIALSFRFGLPSAILGLVGGFAAPALVGGEEANLPLLSLYLGLVTAGLTLSGRRQRRPWMGIAALVGGLGWGALLLLAGDPGIAEVLALGLYFIVLGAVLPALTGAGQWERPLRLASAFVASVQLALLVDQGGYSPLAWSLYLLLGLALAFFGWRKPEIREANAVTAVVAVLLLAQWDGASGAFFAVVAGAIAAVFALVPLAFLWRGEDRDIDILQLCGTTIGLGAVAYATFGAFEADTAEPMLALAATVLAGIPGLAAWRLWPRKPTLLTIALASSVSLIFAALLMMTPGWSAPLAAAAAFAVVFWLLRNREEKPLKALLWVAVFVSFGALAFGSGFEVEFDHLFGQRDDGRSVLAVLRWLAVGLVFAAMAWRERAVELRRFGEAAAAVFAYGALAQLVPPDGLAWTAAFLAIAVWFALRERVAAQVAALSISALWTIEPLAIWTEAAFVSLAGEPVFVIDLPTMWTLATRLLPITVALAVIRSPNVQGLLPRPLPLEWLVLPFALLVSHILFKQIFAIETVTRFVELGLAERTLWQILLLGGAWLAASGIPSIGQSRPLAMPLATLALAHFALYTALLHNPLWDRQAVGPVPVANLALAAYAIALIAIWSLRHWLGEKARIPADALTMLLASLGALTLLRQAFAGSILVDLPMSQTEDLLRSLLGILLALFFLFLGSKRQERSWRVGSLALILLAVAKVFLFDAAGLEGLLRIASFMALGFSLIGIGWVYSRQLRVNPEETSAG